VIVPPAVAEELRQERTPDPVKSWLSNPPDWLQVKTLSHVLERARHDLGAGEREAIELAQELSADALLVDDRDARDEARRLGIPVLGTLLVLADASEHGFADLSVAFARLQQTKFRPVSISSIGCSTTRVVGANRRCQLDAPIPHFEEALAQFKPTLLRRRFAGLICASRFRSTAIIGASTRV
jgi:predicted nucleic acid-binding protein